MIEVVERVLDYGVVEKRTYENGKLMGIQKVYPSASTKRHSYIPRSPGSSGGHDH